MKLLRFLFLLQLAAPLALSSPGHQSQSAGPRTQPDALVRSLYTQVVARHPVGIPYGEDMKIFTPYLSEALLHKIDLAVECGNNWRRKNPGADLKPEVGWLELGFFSGENERASPQTFLIEKTQPDEDDSVRVYVRLTRAYAEGPPSIWRVVAVLTPENDHFVLGDVIYLKDKDYDEDRLSDALSAGCDGPRWVGFGKQK